MAPSSVAGLAALLADARLEGELGRASSWCSEMGIESLDDLFDAEMEAELLAALGLKAAKAKIFSKHLAAARASRQRPESQSGKLKVSDVI